MKRLLLIAALCFFAFIPVNSQAQQDFDSWNPTNTGLGNDTVLSLATHGQYVIAGTAQGAFLSVDTGTTYMAFNNNMPLNDRKITALYIDGTVVLAGTGNGNIYKISQPDTALMWNQVCSASALASGFSNYDIKYISRSGTNIIAQAGAGSCIPLLSTDLGVNWAQGQGTGCDFQKATTANSDNSGLGYVVAGSWNGPLLSKNNGNTWGTANQGITGTSDFSVAGAVAYSPENPYTRCIYYSFGFTDKLYFMSASTPLNMDYQFSYNNPGAYVKGDYDETYSWIPLWDGAGVWEPIRRFAQDVGVCWGIGDHVIYKCVYGWPTLLNNPPNINLSNKILSATANRQYLYLGLQSGGIVRGKKSCSSVVNSYFEILPANPAASNGKYICYNKATNNGDTTGLNYLWDFGDGSNSTQRYPSHTYTSPGHYQICLTVSSGNSNCTSVYCDTSIYAVFKSTGYGLMSELNVVAPVATAIQEIGANEQISIYPNPATDFVTIANLPVGSSLKIMDITGSVVYSSGNNDSQTLVSAGHLANGMYIIHVENKGAIIHKKLFVNR